MLNNVVGVLGGASAPQPKATGGTTVLSNGYWYHTFTSSGTFTPLQSLTVDLIVMAGGGAGGSAYAGGGGAGGFLDFTSQSVTATGYTVTVGACKVHYSCLVK